MLRTSEEKFFKLFLWYFLKIFSFYNKIMYWQAHISHSHPNLDYFTLLNLFLSFLICTFYIFLFSSYLFSLVSDSACFHLSWYLLSHICVFSLTSFSSTSAFFLTSFFQLVLFTDVFVRCPFSWWALLSPLPPLAVLLPFSPLPTHSFLFHSPRFANGRLSLEICYST